MAADLIETVCAGLGNRLIWCSDAGMTRRCPAARARCHGLVPIDGGGPRKSAYGLAHVLPTAGRYSMHPTKANIQFKTVSVLATECPSGKAETWIATRNVADRERQLELSLTRFLERSEGGGCGP